MSIVIRYNKDKDKDKDKDDALYPNRSKLFYIL